jgi:two-component system, chemotaxis family, protein-glutamate methylesterase/glutaminase
MARHATTLDQMPDRDTRTRVMLVDDSIVVRSIAERIIEDAGDFAVVASLPNAHDALDWLASDRVDLIVLDIEMPGMSGIAALPQLLERSSGARIIILSANCEEGGPAAIEALALGAADTLLKPGKGTFAGRFGETLIARLRCLAHGEGPAEVVAVPGPPPPAAAPIIVEPHAIAAIGIGASTGGIMAINHFLSCLSDTVDCPIFITQHLPAGFIPFFAEQLDRSVSRSVVVAEAGMRVSKNHIYLAPGEAHMRLTKAAGGTRIMLDSTPVANGACPSVDPMMATLAAVYGQSACAIILSGMGRDGHEGVRDVGRAGGLVLAQDVASSVVWGMPGAIARSGLARLTLAPEEIGRYVSNAVMAVEPVA